MLANLKWTTLEELRTHARLTLLSKAIYHLVAINLHCYMSKPDITGTSTCKLLSISFHHSIVKKNCYGFSFMPGTMAKRNYLPSVVG